MKRSYILALAVCSLVVTSVALAGDPAKKAEEPSGSVEATSVPEPTPSQEQIDAGKASWIEVARVLQSPRCMNCHPDGDSPLQTDASRPHAMNVSRRGMDKGLACSTCHREENADEIGIVGGPPGAPNWHLPPVDMPMIFQGRSVAQLCAQLKDPAQNGHKTLEQLVHHVSHDPLVLWGWNPGGDRSKPPMSHEAFVGHFKTWVASNGACPDL